MFLIYTRRSTDDADNQKNSLEYQESECRKHAKNHHLAVTSENTLGVMDTGVIYERHSAYKSSALSFSTAGMVEYQIERPKFMQMVAWLLEGKYEGAIVLCWDRISRNEQSDLIVKELIDKHGIRIIFVQADYEPTSAGALHRDIDGMFSRHWSRQSSEKVRATFQKMKVNDKKFPHQSCIGYLDISPEEKVLDPVRAPMVKRMFDLYATGEWSVTQLTKEMKRQGLTNKPRRRRRTKEEILEGFTVSEKTSNAVSPNGIHYSLRNKFVIGKIRHRGEWVDGNHVPLIEVPIFETVQRLLAEDYRSAHRVDKEFFAFRGLVNCKCGRGFSPYRAKKNNEVYYQCKCLEGCGSTTKNIHERIIISQVQQAMDTLHFTDEELRQIESGKQSGIKKAATMRDKALEDLNRRRKHILDDLDYLKENKITLLRGGATPEELKADADKLTAKLEQIDNENIAYTETEKEMVDFVIAFSELVKSASSLYKVATDIEKFRLTKLMFSELTIFDGKLSYVPTDEFAPLFNRHFVENGGSGGI
ncbi:MAG: recombinase family protein [Candidatus Peribacter sp.]